MCFGNDKSYPGIQAADILAYESRRLMIERTKNPDYEPTELYLALTFFLHHQPKLYTPAILDELAQRTNEALKANNESSAAERGA
jgi:hypothetical protein